MCKLCDGSIVLKKVKAKKKKHDTSEFEEAVKDYTGEYPCKYCIKTFIAGSIQRGIDKDTYIINKLFAAATKDKKRKKASAVSHITKLLAGKPEFKIVPGIHKIISGDGVAYRLNIGRLSGRINKTCKTLEEALFEKVKFELLHPAIPRGGHRPKGKKVS